MKLTKKIVAFAVSIIAVAATTISASAYYMYAFTPSSTLKANGVTKGSNHVTYGMDYTLADATPSFSMTIPANSGSGKVTVYYEYHHGVITRNRQVEKTFSNSASSQYINKTGSVVYNIPITKNKTTYTDFTAETNNSNVTNSTVNAVWDVYYH